MIQPLARYVATAASLTIGTDLFAGVRPATAPVACVVLREAGGPPSFAEPDHVEALVQVVARGASYFAARTLAYAVHAALHGKSGIYLPGETPDEGATPNEWRCASIGALALPQLIPAGPAGPGTAYEFSTTYLIRAQEV